MPEVLNYTNKSDETSGSGKNALEVRYFSKRFTFPNYPKLLWFFVLQSSVIVLHSKLPNTL